MAIFERIFQFGQVSYPPVPFLSGASTLQDPYFRLGMSLHAQLSPEAEARLDAQRRNSVVTSVVIALLVIALVVLVLLFILLPSLMIKSPTIVAYQAGAPEEDTMDQKEVNRQIQRKPSAPSS